MDERQTHKINRPNSLEDKHDLISHLPDSLLLHILSLLTMEDVVKTSILSSRWRYLWTSILCLNFEGCVTGRNIDKTTFIDTCLFHHEGNKVRKLNIVFDYSQLTNSLQVDSWIRFASRRDVEDLKLDFHNGEILDFNFILPDSKVYKLPHSLFKCGSLTTLTLCGCDLNLPVCISLSSLKTLSLQQIDSSSEAIEHLTSSCPILEDLSLIFCSTEGSNLNICITNEHVKTLTVFQSNVAYSYEVNIHAPKLVSLEIFNGLLCVASDVMGLLSLKSASFNLEDMYGDGMLDYEDEMLDLYKKDYIDVHGLASVLRGLHHVEVLRLSSWCIQILSLTEVQRADHLPLNATCLHLETGLTKWELPGTAFLLKSCLNIEDLTVTIQEVDAVDLSPEFKDNYDFDGKEYWKSLEFDLRYSLQKTKTIKIYGFCRITTDIEIAFVEFLQFLLKHSKVLERMIISTTDKQSSSTVRCLTSEMLTGFPRASPAAELIFT